jgi:hypothetical protein
MGDVFAATHKIRFFLVGLGERLRLEVLVSLCFLIDAATLALAFFAKTRSCLPPPPDTNQTASIITKYNMTFSCYLGIRWLRLQHF